MGPMLWRSCAGVQPLNEDICAAICWVSSGIAPDRVGVNDVDTLVVAVEAVDDAVDDDALMLHAEPVTAYVTQSAAATTPTFVRPRRMYLDI